jgi:putative Holliday junction resolvase
MPDAGSGSKTPAPHPTGTLLAFDYGRRRIGVAVGQTLTRTASALAVVKVSDHPDWQAITTLIEQWKPAALIVGLPVAEDGTATPLSTEAGEFGRSLKKKHKLAVLFQDERLTSFEAEGRFIDARGKGSMRKKDAALKDAMAAQIILENWLQSTP